MAVITPAVAGPFDLGTVVVRVALNVNPETAQINAVSDQIPDVFGGAKLDIRSIDVNVDRPSSCSTRRTAPHRRRAASSTAAERRPDAVQLLRRQRSVPGNRMQQTGLQAEAVHAAVRADQAGQEPADPGDPGSAQRRRQHGPHGADAAALAVPRPEPHQDGVHAAAARLADVSERRGLRPGGSEIAAARQQVEGPGLPGVLRRQIAEPGGRPARPGEDPAARRDQLQAGRSQDRVPGSAGRAGEEVHPQHAGRPEEPDRQLGKPLRRRSRRPC